MSSATHFIKAPQTKPIGNAFGERTVPDGVELEADRLLPLCLPRHDERPRDVPVTWRRV